MAQQTPSLFFGSKDVKAIGQAYVTAATVDVEFRPTNLHMTIEAAAGTKVFYSFDGTNNHGVLIAGVADRVSRRTRRKKLWFKVTTDVACTVHVEMDSDDPLNM